MGKQTYRQDTIFGGPPYVDTHSTIDQKWKVVVSFVLHIWGKGRFARCVATSLLACDLTNVPHHTDS